MSLRECVGFDYSNLLSIERVPKQQMIADHFGFTPKELRKLRSMKDPYGIQKFLDAMPYHLEDTA